VIRDKGTAGEEFASALRDRAKSEGIRISADLEFLPSQARDPACLEELARKLARVPKEQLIVMGTQYGDTPELLRVLRDKRGPFPAVGYSSLAADSLADQFSKTENERHEPGYYTDGFLVAAPQLGDVAEYSQTVFANRFKARYGADPTPEAVRWYEAVQLILQVIQATGVSGTDRSADRRRIRDWIAARDRPDSAAQGVAGPIYFDKDRNAERGITVGVFYSGKLISAPMQFASVSDVTQVPGWDQLKVNGMIIDASGTKYVKIPVVYAGINMNSLDNIDVRTSNFTADFFLWFRYPQDQNLDPHEVEFPTAISGAQLGHEVARHTSGSFNTVTYRVKGLFRSDYEFARFPFDIQTLRFPIQFHNSTNYTLLLAYGGTSSREAAAQSVLASNLWHLKDQFFYRDVITFKSSFGDDSARSRQTDQPHQRCDCDPTRRTRLRR
jgi:branched-chain amino acid transport system substrate-binding protein